MQNNWFGSEVSSEQQNQHNDNNIYLNKQEMKIVMGLHKISVHMGLNGFPLVRGIRKKLTFKCY